MTSLSCCAGVTTERCGRRARRRAGRQDAGHGRDHGADGHRCGDRDQGHHRGARQQGADLECRGCMSRGQVVLNRPWSKVGTHCKPGESQAATASRVRDSADSSFALFSSLSRVRATDRCCQMETAYLPSSSVSLEPGMGEGSQFACHTPRVSHAVSSLRAGRGAASACAGACQEHVHGAVHRHQGPHSEAAC